MLLFNKKCTICGQVKRQKGSLHCAVCAMNFHASGLMDSNGLPIGWQERGDANFKEIVQDTKAHNIGKALLGLGILVVLGLLTIVNNLLGL